MAASTVQAVPKLYDVILWLLGRVEKFPRSQKVTLGDRLVNISLDILDTLIEATYTRKRLPLLQKANVQFWYASDVGESYQVGTNKESKA